ncbi:MAG: sigma-70 family RNA polymerase sigma factor [Candidatus Eremiobacterota bacterium]
MENHIPSSELIPREILFAESLKTNPRISPDGKRVLYQVPENNLLNFWIKTAGEEDDRLVFTIKQTCISQYFWHNDTSVLYLHDETCSGNFLLCRLDLETGEIKILTSCKDSNVIIIKYDRNYPDEMILSINKYNREIYDLYHIDLISGHLTLLQKNPGNITDWVIDNRLRLKGIVVTEDDGSDRLMVRDDEHKEWKVLDVWEVDDKPLSLPVCASEDDVYFIGYNNSITSGLIKLNIKTGERKLLAGHEKYDVYTLMINKQVNPFRAYTVLINRTYEIQAICFNKFRREWIILDEAIKEDFETLKGIDRGDFAIVNCDDTFNLWLVCFEHDNGPAAYYLFNRTSKKEIFLFYNQSSLNNYNLSTMEEVTFTSGDGLDIHGYITYPTGNKRTGLPMVLYVHKGPWARDFWGYNPTVQWMANRGYVCLQINYRGSLGYGKDFLNAGNKEWGGKMQDDLLDAVRWAIKKSIADPGRIAIYGSGYGGYASLLGATSSSFFCCSVATECPANLITFLQAFPPPFWKIYHKRWADRIGEPSIERELLISRSPFYNVANIRIPLLIAHGLKDEVISSTESYQVVRAIQSLGLDVEYVVFPDEGHNIKKPKNLLKFYVMAEKFLSRYLGGSYEPREIYGKDIYLNDIHFNDKKLIDKILKEGDKYAFEHLVDYYKKPLLKYLINTTGNADLSRELLHDIFSRVWLYLESYSSDRPFDSWLFKIAFNVVKKHRIKEHTLIQEIHMNPDIISQSAGNIENQLLLNFIVKSLKEPYKTAFILRFINGMNYREIASLMNTSNQQVKNYLYRVKKNIHKLWIKYSI